MIVKIIFGFSVISLFLMACSKSKPGADFTESTSPKVFQPASEIDSVSRNSILDDEPSDKIILGKMLFFDADLSEPNGQSCASCHSPEAGFADPDKQIPVSEGVIIGNFGMRNALSASYVKFTPPFSIDSVTGEASGGQFWDGRKIDLEDQAKAPFLNPLEMNNPSFETVVSDVMTSSYAPLFLSVYGANAFDDFEMAYENIADAIATYERSEELNAFTAEYDLFRAGSLVLSTEEALGLELFTGKAKCVHCHKLNSADGGLDHDLFTNFKFANIGLPKNADFPLDLLPEDSVDQGLGGITGNPEHNGQFKTPHLRNIEQTAPYMHNGLLKSLSDVVHFYNTRDVQGTWPEPEVPENMVIGMIGDLGLTENEEEAIVEFLETLTDDMPLSSIVPVSIDSLDKIED